MHNVRRRSKEVAENRRESYLSRFAAVFRRIVGMPDYDGYVEHLRRCHPGSAVPSQREFFDQYLSTRYSGGPTRCC